MDPGGPGRVVRTGAALYAVGVVATHASAFAGRPPAAYLALLSDEPLWLTGLWLAAVACLVAAGRPTVPAAAAFAFGLGPLLVESYLLYHTVSPSGAVGAVNPAVGGTATLAALRFAAALAVVVGALAGLYRGADEPDRDSRVSTP